MYRVVTPRALSSKTGFRDILCSPVSTTVFDTEAPLRLRNSSFFPNAGDFKRSDIGDKPVVVVRDEKGEINVVANRCAHRGVAFCQHAFGTAKEFVCPYYYRRVMDL